MNKICFILVAFILLSCVDERSIPYTNTSLASEIEETSNYFIVESIKLFSNYTQNIWSDGTIVHNKFWTLKNAGNEIIYKGSDQEELEIIWNDYLLIRNREIGQGFVDNISIYDLKSRRFILLNGQDDFVLPFKKIETDQGFPIIYKFINAVQKNSKSDGLLLEVHLKKIRFFGGDQKFGAPGEDEIYEVRMN